MSDRKTCLQYLKSCYHFLTLLRVEPYLFAFMFVYTLKKVPTDQLIQDKICRFRYQLDVDYCTKLPEMMDEEDYLNKKSQILANGTTFTIYQVILVTLPSMVASLFIGSWTDKYLNAKRVLLIAGAVTAVCEAIILVLCDYFYDKSEYLVLISCLPGILSGGMLAVLAAIWSYIASTTPSHMRALRMIFAEITIGISQPLGTYIGGLVLNMKPIFKTGQLHNYTGVFTIAGVMYLAILIWTVIFVNEKRDINKWEQKFPSHITESITSDNNTDDIVNSKLKTFDEYKHIKPIKLLFDLKNAKEMWRTCSRKRHNHLRLQIWLLFLSFACFIIAHVGPIIFMFQFTQKVYGWDSQTYSTWSAITSGTGALATFIIAPLLLKILKISDITLSLVGLVSYFLQNIIWGTVLYPKGYYYALIPGCLGGVASIGMRSYFSKIIGPEELGKLFNCLGSLESITPLITAGIFINIFNATMDSQPGLSLILVAILLIIPFVILIWINFYNNRNPYQQNELKSISNL
ncbi:uncharacterized protein LOC128955852 [Oppia nitens]|uniref:uncharacterized protein LOC128955852 n=1 Tax=Oppia nitens TaxID=1686743 RepID=UPI0023DA710C|nr:uncharacterized protein LOC128955852 [Oppia nitens]